MRGFVVKPFGCIFFVSLLDQLGYRTEPEPDFHFTRSNIHFSCDAVPGARRGMDRNVVDVIGTLMTDQMGYVRVSRSPTTGKAQIERPLEERTLDIRTCKFGYELNGEPINAYAVPH